MAAGPDGRATRRRLRAGLAVLLLVLAAVGAGASRARADEDPAGTVLASQPLFLPPDAHASPGEAAGLRSLLRETDQAGFPVRVAVIPSEYDLGSVTALWHRPRTYVRYLSGELAHLPREPLLVVMPGGLGLAWPGHSEAAADRELAGLGVRSGGDGLLLAARAAVGRLASGNGIQLASASRSHAVAGRGGGRDGTTIAIVAAAAAVLLAALAARPALTQRLRRDGRSAPRTGRTRRASESTRAFLAGRRWAVPGIAAAGCLAAGVPILLVGLLRHAPAASGTRLGGLGTPYTWQAGRRRAPGFRLRGEDGRPVSLAAYRGRPVIITFVDPMCRDLCPLSAHVLNQVDRELPAARRPVILGVSVNVYGDTRADLRRDSRRWDLVPQWHWAIGSRRRLSAVWRAYHVGVSVSRTTIAGTTVHSVSHDEVAFLVDRSGYVRALYGWPYYPQDVIAAVERLGWS